MGPNAIHIPPLGALASQAVSSLRSPRAWYQLYFQPRTFFARHKRLGSGVEALLVAFVVGLSWAVGQFDADLARAVMGHLGPSGQHVVSTALSAWPDYWLLMGVAGVVCGAGMWFIGGSWYAWRLNRCHALHLPGEGRRVYAYQELISAVPVVLLMLAQTAGFPNAATAFRADAFWASILVIFPFWSCWTSYAAVTAAFRANPVQARWWFFWMPVSVYAVILIGAALVGLAWVLGPG